MNDLKSFGIVTNIRHAGTAGREFVSPLRLDETPGAEGQRAYAKKAPR